VSKQEKDDTPLIAAARRGNLRDSVLLLKAGANPKAVNKVRTWVHVGPNNRRKDRTIEYILRCSYDVNSHSEVPWKTISDATQLCASFRYHWHVQSVSTHFCRAPLAFI
jgi:ankyrin repeat protein